MSRWLAVVFALAIGAVVAAETEEAKPTLAEAKAAFAKADRALNEAWAAVTKATSGQTLEELKAGQRDWLEFRNDRAGRESEQAGETDPKQSQTWNSVAAALSEERTAWLQARAQAASGEENWSGQWTDSYGGTMRVLQKEHQFFFAIEVVRGPTYHLGGVTGVASWNQKIGWWSDKGRDPEKTVETNLAFIDRDGCLEVIGANTSEYHGARAYFDGIYCRTGPLKKEDEAELIKAAESGELPDP